MEKYRTIKKYMAAFVALILLFSVTYTLSDEDRHSDEFYSKFKDVTNRNWYYEAANELCLVGVIPEAEYFNGESSASRYDIVLYLYNLSNVLKTQNSENTDNPFSDVNENMESYKPIVWAYNNGIASGFPDNTFMPGAECTREQVACMAMRFINYADIKVSVKGNDNPFEDSMKVSNFARSDMVALKLAGIINGSDSGYVYPSNAITRGELAAIVYNLYKSSGEIPSEGASVVNTEPGAYNDKYIEYEIIAREKYDPVIYESGAVDVSYFDDAIFVGDSVTMSLQFYCASTGGLGKATFLCAGSLSPMNCYWEINENSIHPLYQGRKVFVEDGVALSGAKKVYIMLGINGIYNADLCIANMKILVDNILAKTPDAKIIIQSVTPMIKDYAVKGLTNSAIAAYNDNLRKMAKENGWYYLNIAEAVTDKNGNLKMEYCSDPQDMGIHFNYTADKVWIDYLKTHTPQM